MRSFWVLAGYTVVASIFFGVTFPTHFLIADEVAYFEQALAWSGGAPAVASDYPPGTALLAAILVGVFGPKAVFLSGIGTFLVGIWAVAGVLQHSKKPVVWALYPALFLPGLVLTRTLMSDLPSFALASLFLRLYISQPVHPSTRFTAGLAAGLGVLFRETNLLWALPFMVGALWRGRVNTTPKPCLPFRGSVGVGTAIRAAFPGQLWLGFIIGIAPRLAWGWFTFGDPLFIRDSGIGFSMAFLPQNLSFYLLGLFVLAPGGFYFLAKNRSPYYWEIAAASVLFIVVYGCYGYDAFAKSGWKGLVLQGRFLLPLLPFVTLAAAETMPANGRIFRYGIPMTAVLFFAVVQFFGHAYNLEQQRITDALLHLPEQTLLTFTPDESRKYLNALHEPRLTTFSCQTNLSSPQNCFAHLITRTDSADRIKKTAEAEAAFQQYARGRETILVTDLTIRDGTRLRIWRFKQPDLSE